MFSNLSKDNIANKDEQIFYFGHIYLVHIIVLNFENIFSYFLLRDSETSKFYVYIAILIENLYR